MVVWSEGENRGNMDVLHKKATDSASLSAMLGWFLSSGEEKMRFTCPPSRVLSVKSSASGSCGNGSPILQRPFTHCTERPWCCPSASEPITPQPLSSLGFAQRCFPGMPRLTVTLDFAMDYAGCTIGWGVIAVFPWSHRWPGCGSSQFQS